MSIIGWDIHEPGGISSLFSRPREHVTRNLNANPTGDIRPNHSHMVLLATQLDSSQLDKMYYFFNIYIYI